MPSATASAPGRQPPQKARAEKGGRPAACDRLHHPHLEERRVRSGTQALLTRPWMERAEACGMDAGWEERWLGEPGAGVLRGLALKGWEETQAPQSPPTRHARPVHGPAVPPAGGSGRAWVLLCRCPEDPRSGRLKREQQGDRTTVCVCVHMCVCGCVCMCVPLCVRVLSRGNKGLLSLLESRRVFLGAH